MQPLCLLGWQAIAKNMQKWLKCPFRIKRPLLYQLSYRLTEL